MVALACIFTILVAYLLGSIPTGFMVGKAHGIDIRTLGSGNIGATNVFRHLGVPAGVGVLFADALKGWLAVAVLARWVCRWIQPAAEPQVLEWFELSAGSSAILGHNFTCWLRFKGGKGIATSAGVLLALVPEALMIIVAIWGVVFALSRYVSLASMAASFTLPFACWLTGKSATLIAITALMAALAIYKHKSNIKRLIEGTENRVGCRSRPAVPGPQQNR